MVTEGLHTYLLYAGAARCDTNRGELVGAVGVTFSNDEVNVEYSLVPGVWLEETHVYIGNDILPIIDGTYTTSPGQYGNIHNLRTTELRETTDTYTIPRTDPYHFIGHAVVCHQN